MKIRKHFDRWSLVVIAMTIALFLAAPFTSGIFHDLLLEAGVFLVSVKLILMAYKSSLTAHALEAKLDQVHLAIQQLAQRPSEGGNPPISDSPQAARQAGDLTPSCGACRSWPCE